MAQTSDVAAYICANYPHKSELSKTRLTKLVYLADWEAAKSAGRQITDIRWFFHNYGPYVDDVIESAKRDDRFKIIKTTNHYGDTKNEIRIRDGADTKRGLNPRECAIIDNVINETRHMYWNTFIKHVYDTDPIKNSDRYTLLDLVDWAGRKNIEA